MKEPEKSGKSGISGESPEAETGEVVIRKERLFNEFMTLAGIDSLSLKEGRMAEYLKKFAKREWLSVASDDAAAAIGGQTGNLVLTCPGDPGRLPLFFSTHMDTVVPGERKKTILKDGVFVSGGDTILGADDLAGIAVCLEAVRAIRESGVRHGDIQLVFSAAEEIGLMGARHMDLSMITARQGFVLDHHGKPGRAVCAAPYQDIMEISVHGHAAHAGIEPEKGVSAIEVFSNAVAAMRLGRLDAETTANIGMVQAGSATNIVCPELHARAEARSLSERKLVAQTAHMEKVLREAAAKAGATVDFTVARQYPGFRIGAEDLLVELFRRAADMVGLPVVLEVSGGGSDANVFAGAGYRVLNIACGMEKVHTTEEYLPAADLLDTARLVIALIIQAAAGPRQE